MGVDELNDIGWWTQGQPTWSEIKTKTVTTTDDMLPVLADPIQNLYVMGGSVTFSPGGAITTMKTEPDSKPAREAWGWFDFAWKAAAGLAYGLGVWWLAVTAG